MTSNYRAFRFQCNSPLLPNVKGKASDQAQKVVYNDKYDCNLVIAFSPREIFHDSEKQDNMNEAFIRVAELLA